MPTPVPRPPDSRREPAVPAATTCQCPQALAPAHAAGLLALLCPANLAMTSDLPRLMLAMGLLALAVIGLVALAVAARKLLKGGGDRFDLEGGFSIVDLRQMLRDGQITDEEYERAKASVADRGRKLLAADQLPSDRRAVRPMAAVEPETGDVDPDEPQPDSDNDTQDD